VLYLVSMEGLEGSGTCWQGSLSTPHSAGRTVHWQQSVTHSAGRTVHWQQSVTHSECLKNAL